MTRNQTRRVEIACPVSSPEIKKILGEYLDRILADNQKARRLKSDGNYVPAEGEGEPLDLQKWYMEHPLELAETVVPRKGFKNRFFGMFRK